MFFVSSQSTRVTDRYTDGRTDVRTDTRTDRENYDLQDRASIAASRGKNLKHVLLNINIIIIIILIFINN